MARYVRPSTPASLKSCFAQLKMTGQGTLLRRPRGRAENDMTNVHKMYSPLTYQGIYMCLVPQHEMTSNEHRRSVSTPGLSHRVTIHLLRKYCKGWTSLFGCTPPDYGKERCDLRFTRNVQRSNLPSVATVP